MLLDLLISSEEWTTWNVSRNAEAGPDGGVMGMRNGWNGVYSGDRFPAKREQSQMFQRLLPESQSQNLALTLLCVPYSLDSGPPEHETQTPETRAPLAKPNW